MKKGIFNSQLNVIEQILKKLDILKDRNENPNYKNYQASFFRNKSYSEVWKQCVDLNLFDFMLTDNAILQFRFNSTSSVDLSYAFYECPYKPLISYEEFERKIRISRNDECDEFEILRQYDYYENTPEIKESTTPIRYDYNTSLYIEGRHPASHLHLGYKSNIRIGSKKILRPISFLLLILRQWYPDTWIKFLNSENAEILCRNIREHPSDIDPKYWNRKDEFEMILV